MPLVVSLTTAEWSAAQSIGTKRHNLRVERGREQVEAKDNGGTWLYKNTYGIVAEYALAKHYGAEVLKDWAENKAFSLEHWKIPCDVGRNLHVRAVDRESKRLLIVHEDRERTRVEAPAERRGFRVSDPENGVFILAWVDERNLRVTFWGWRTARDVRILGKWNTTDTGFREQDRHAYTLDRDQLNPMNTIHPEDIW